MAARGALAVNINGEFVKVSTITGNGKFYRIRNAADASMYSLTILKLSGIQIIAGSGA
jgi:hypothetical protein